MNKDIFRSQNSKKFSGISVQMLSMKSEKNVLLSIVAEQINLSIMTSTFEIMLQA